jgi:hypothetical protein
MKALFWFAGLLVGRLVIYLSNQSIGGLREKYIADMVSYWAAVPAPCVR